MENNNRAPLERQNSIPLAPRTPIREPNQPIRDLFETDSDEEFVFSAVSDVVEKDSDEEFLFSAVTDGIEMDSDEEFAFSAVTDVIETDSDEEYAFSAVAGEKPAKAENANSKKVGPMTVKPSCQCEKHTIE